MAIDDTALAALLDEAVIARLIARYASMTDWLDWEAIRPLFTADAHFDFGAMCRGGLEAYLPFVQPMEAGYDRRMHMMGLPRVELAGDEARAEAPSLIHARNHASDGSDHHADLLFYGRYMFTARREGGTWKLASLRYYLSALYPLAAEVMDESALNTATGFAPSHADAMRHG
ncbi:MAG TPA: nuclear transport factor 2 family protein [Novosphingobium sp.]|nr:nuclear transport factor 2 family protein [Novosphingobium sp.]HZV11404.1 nuclear transport factor 2 family protein [Novosphingobium sp.]